jgi:hypothetical protein
MLRVKNILPNNFVEINTEVVGANIGNVKVRSFNKNPSSVHKCLVINLWAYHTCASSGNELVLEVPLKIQIPVKIEKEKNSCLKFDMGIFNLSTQKYTGFIEYDGFSGHFTDVKQIKNDLLKERFCKTVGVKLLRISSRYTFNIRELDFWFSQSSGVSYFSPHDYLERNNLVKVLNL